MPADPPPRLRLWHLTESRFSAGSPEFASHTKAFTVQRPKSGYAHATVECPACGAELRLRVASVRELRRSFRVPAAVFGGGALAIAVGVTLLLTTAAVWLPVILLVGGVLVAVTGAAFRSWATGVRPLTALPDGKPGPHVVRPDRA